MAPNSASQTHQLINPIIVAADAVPRLVAFVHSTYPALPITLVADTRTYAAAGADVARELRAAGRAVQEIILRGEHVHADELGVARVLTACPAAATLFVAVGSGTVTDITRYVSFRLGRPFVAVPTAASVDGFASAGSPLVIEGVKRTHPARVPQAIFADPAVLAAAPRELTAAGCGDLLGKITSTADWQLGRLIRNEPYDWAIATRAESAVQRFLPQMSAIARREPSAITTLFESLIETGLCMVDAGESRPASGAEHHISHLWEMFALRDNLPTALHGAQVGVATVLVAELYQRLRSLDAAAARCLLAARLPLARAEQEAEIEAAYGPAAATIIHDHADYLSLTAADQEALAARIIEQWDNVLAIARAVPDPAWIRDLLKQVGAPVDAADLGLSAGAATLGIRHAHYLRSRFTVAKLVHYLGLPNTH